MTNPTLHLTDAQAQRLVDGALSPGEAPEVERHAAGCAACQATVETYRLLASALDDLELPPLPADFTDGVLARIDARERASAREHRHALAILGVLALATVGAFAVAGAAAWAPLLSRSAEVLGTAARAIQVGSSFVPEVVGALRLQILVVTAALALPLLVALARLMPPQRAEIA